LRVDVQGLRAVAVLLVIADHADVGFLDGGFVGVDVFFVVSGYVITALLLSDGTTNGRIRLGAFYARRARRILPAASLVLIVTSIYAALTFSISRIAEVVDDVTWSAFFAANVHFIGIGTDYADLGRSPSLVQHFWSLAVEEQFYLVWPILLLLLGSGRRLRLALFAVGAIWASSLALALWQTGVSPAAAYFSSLTRAWELATGAGLALVTIPELGRRARGTLASVGLIAIAASAILFGPATPFPGTAALLPVLGTAAVIVAGERGPVVGPGHVLVFQPLPWIGDLSYSLYLWHWPVLVLGRDRLGTGVVDTLVLLAVVLAASVCSYYCVENPIRRAHGFLARPAIAMGLWPVALGSVMASVLWADSRATVLADELERRSEHYEQTHPPKPGTSTSLAEIPIQMRLKEALRRADDGAPVPHHLVNLDSLSRDLWQFHYRCSSDWDDTTNGICPVGDATSQRVLVVYGDSHAGMWLPMLDRLAARRHFKVVPFIKYGCSAFDVEQYHAGAPFPECDVWRQWALEAIDRLDPTLIVTSYRSFWEARSEPGASVAETWARGVESAITHWRQLTSGRVIIISDITALGFGPPDCLTARDATLQACVTREDPVTIDGNRVTKSAAERAGATFADVTGLVCFRGRCPLVVDNIVTYRDEGHISVTWGSAITDELGDLIPWAP